MIKHAVVALYLAAALTGCSVEITPVTCTYFEDQSAVCTDGTLINVPW